MVQLVPYNSILQIQSLALRYAVLRKPLGLMYNPEELLQEKDQHHLVYLEGNKVIGVLLLAVHNQVVKMRQVAVGEELQGKGIGREMVVFAENWAVDNQFEKIELHARETAVPFYLKLSYKIVGERFDEVGIPHFKMIKLL